MSARIRLAPGRPRPAAPAAKKAPEPVRVPGRRWWHALFPPAPSTFHRCLALHMLHAGDPAAWVRFGE